MKISRNLNEVTLNELKELLDKQKFNVITELIIEIQCHQKNLDILVNHIRTKLDNIYQQINNSSNNIELLDTHELYNRIENYTIIYNQSINTLQHIINMFDDDKTKRLIVKLVEGR